jgi:predicted HAD superfamily Cof-like phosphohydrolase
VRSIIDRIFRFNLDLIGVQPHPAPAPFLSKDHEWTVLAIHEEGDELETATTTVDQVDALVDVCVFAIGGLCKLGLTEVQVEACFNAVMDANFKKKAGANPNRPVEGVKDGYKPEGWVPPEAAIEEILYGRK